MADRKDTLLSFLRDTRLHEMTIELDQGVHRSIRFGRPGSSVYHFRLTTWAGHLAISGDMGTYVFARHHDMFTFFRPVAGKLEINPQYWHEKMQAGCKYGSAKTFSDECFKSAVKDMTDRWETTLGEADDLRKEIADELLNGDCSNEHEAYELLRDFSSRDGHEFTDVGDYDLTDWSHGFLWALYAIVWGIKKYDQLKDGRTQADHDRRVLAGDRADA
ncbi:hypothetical protein [Pararhodobacter zhoushanensis]|uniref:DUF4304 domain-containing protein n=1 Tax=Pararhodobacter zhoushanensis TaxID=2479545 RepID=A0ABT3GYM2_9RHOB|nr:hypothetical protein [Pararhodobacter zhoushanensis]MCW1932648.1 hypothetical protein [Pararhodobacter zhoushanensis]